MTPHCLICLKNGETISGLLNLILFIQQFSDLFSILLMLDTFLKNTTLSTKSISGCTIVNRCRLVMFYVFVRFFGLDPAQKPAKTRFFRQDNQSKGSTNLLEINLRTKNKRLCRVRVGLTSNCDCIVPAFEIPRVS